MTRHRSARAPARPTRRAALGLLLAGGCATAAGVLVAAAPPRAGSADLRLPVATPSSPVVAAGSGGPQPSAVGAVAPPSGAVRGLVLPGRAEVVPVVPVGVLSSGAMQLPGDPATVGWWVGGAALGAAEGALVLAGHLDARGAGVGAMQALLADDLAGEVHLEDSQGTTFRYTVTARTSYLKSELPADLFAGDGPPRLVLLTCGGRFDESTGHYSDNVVVEAVPTAAASGP